MSRRKPLFRRTKRCLGELSPCLSRRRHPNAHSGHSDLKVGANALHETRNRMGPFSSHQDIKDIAAELLSLSHEVVVEDLRLHFPIRKNYMYVNQRF